jgi:uncharacterized protein YndB with AHSA1/START domain
VVPALVRDPLCALKELQREENSRGHENQWYSDIDAGVGHGDRHHTRRDGPRRLVFEASTRPEHVKRWYGFRRGSIDFRTGGAWPYVLHDPSDGSDHAFSGEYREIVRPERLVCTECYQLIPGSDHAVTVTFSERGKQATVYMHVQYASMEHRDGHDMARMEAGMHETLDRLAEPLEELVSAAS